MSQVPPLVPLLVPLLVTLDQQLVPLVLLVQFRLEFHLHRFNLQVLDLLHYQYFPHPQDSRLVVLLGFHLDLDRLFLQVTTAD